jgi:hypothetical protein
MQVIMLAAFQLGLHDSCVLATKRLKYAHVTWHACSALLVLKASQQAQKLLHPSQQMRESAHTNTMPLTTQQSDALAMQQPYRDLSYTTMHQY